MPVQSANTLNLREISDVIAVNDSLNPQTRSELKSAINTFARACSKDPSEIIADPGAIRTLAQNAHWRLADLSKASWANTMSRVTRALTLAGVKVHRRRRNFKLAPEWETLLQNLKRRDRDDLHRWAGWCSVRGIRPTEVSATTFEDYLTYLLTQSTLRNPRSACNVSRRVWNRVIATPDSNYASIERSEAPEWRALRWSDFPESLVQEVEAYKKKMVTKSLFDKSSRQLKEITVDNYLRNIRVAATRLVENGVPIGSLVSLKTIVTPLMLKRALQAHMGSREIKEALPGLQAIAIAAISVAKFAGLSDAEVAEVKAIFKQVKHSQSGMTAKNKERLAQFSDPKVVERLLELPCLIERVYLHLKKPMVKEALRMQFAVALEILLHAPMRIKNLAALDLDLHIHKPIAGKVGNWRISIPEGDVKNNSPIEAELNPETTRLLARYVSVFRPVLKPGASTAMFPSLGGGVKRSNSLSIQFKSFLKRELGITVNAHLMRHFAVFVYLEANPGDYETARRLLGHKQIQTTMTAYAGGAESKNAWGRFDDVIERRRGRGAPQSKGSMADEQVEDLPGWEDL